MSVTATEKKLPPKSERQRIFATYFKKPPTDVVSSVQTIHNRLVSNLDPNQVNVLDVVWMAKFIEEFTAFAEDCA